LGNPQQIITKKTRLCLKPHAVYFLRLAPYFFGGLEALVHDMQQPSQPFGQQLVQEIALHLTHSLSGLATL
jgi:hypothetical protein